MQGELYNFYQKCDYLTDWNVTNYKIVLPSDQISAVWSYGFSSMSSGAMYSGVP